MQAIEQSLQYGTSYGAPTEQEITLSQMVVKAVPSVEMIRMVNSGTEATMSAIRLARGATGRDIIIKFDGCYHGHADSLLVDAGSGVATLAIVGSPGVPKASIHNTISASFNDIEQVEQLMAARGEQVAAIIVEPIAGNMGLVLPMRGFLEKLRSLSIHYGSLLIFDEVMTGFRVAYGGAQVLYNIKPDLSCFGKIIGGGLPVGAYGGRRDLMEMIAPQGPIYQAGTLSGNPLAMAAGIAMLNELSKPGVYEMLEQSSYKLFSGLKSACEQAGIPAWVDRAGSMLGLFFLEGPVRNFTDAKKSNVNQYAEFYRGMLEEGIYLAPSQFETLFVSLAHDANAINETVSAASSVLQRMRRQ
jgi:glutamate-1-semialdehyde 2,1-aminomutase